MFAALKKYWVTARLCARQMSYFGLADLMGGYLLRLAQMAVMLMVWSALFHQGADMQGMTLNQIRHYDVTGKDCPKYFVEHEDAWVQFRQDVQEYADSL